MPCAPFRAGLWNRRQCHRRAPAGPLRALCPSARRPKSTHRAYANRHEVGLGVPQPPCGCRLLAQGVPAWALSRAGARVAPICPTQGPPSGTPDPPLPNPLLFVLGETPFAPDPPLPNPSLGVDFFSIKNRLFSILISIKSGLAVVWTHFRSKKKLRTFFFLGRSNGH